MRTDAARIIPRIVGRPTDRRGRPGPSGSTAAPHRQPNATEGPDGHRHATLAIRSSPSRPPAAPLDPGRSPRRRGGGRCARDGHRRCGPRRVDGRLRIDQARRLVRRPGKRAQPRRRDQPDRPVQGLSLRHWRPPLLLQERRDQPPLARDPRRRPVHHPPPPQPDLLQPPLLPLPPEARRRLPQARPDPDREDPPRLRPEPPPPHQARAELRGLDCQPLRPRPLRHVLQDLHREGLGDVDQGDFGRLGGAADQGARPDQDRPQRPVPAASAGARRRAASEARSSRP